MLFRSKKANGPSLASATNYNVSQSNRWERHDVRMEADYGQSSASGSRGARMSKAAKVIEKKQKEGK